MSTENSLSGKVAIITGAGQGIGEATALVFAKHGAKVVVVTRTEKNGQNTVDQINNAGGEAILVTGDIGNAEVVERSVEVAILQYGRVDIVVHNAASFINWPIEDYTAEDFDTIFAVNVKPCFLYTKLCAPYMRKQGAGRLLITSSVTGPKVAMHDWSCYSASKSGVNGYIRSAALELARDKITVNGVEPGYISSPQMQTLGNQEELRNMERFIPMGHAGTPEDIAYAMLFLATDEARYITGQTIVVDGGSTLPESPVFANA